MANRFRRITFAIAAAGVVACALAVSVAAQEGHPLKGSWVGTWAGNKTLGNDILIVMTWDGKNVTGDINPGTDNIKIKNATLNPEGWLVHIEADAKDKAGQVTTFTVDGKIENLPLASRSIVGTWKDNKGGTGAFRVGRQ